MTIEDDGDSGRDGERRDDGWHLDKRVPIALVAVLVVQLLGNLWWAAAMQFRTNDHETRITSLERTREERNVAMAAISDRLARIEEQLKFLIIAWQHFRPDSEQPGQWQDLPRKP